MQLKTIHNSITLLFLCGVSFLQAQEVDIKSGQASHLEGVTTSAQLKPSETLSEFARRLDVGYDEVLYANPYFDVSSATAGDTLVVPTSHLILKEPKSEVVVNLPERRLYYRSKNNSITSYPVGIGELGWSTPLGEMTIIGKRKNPSWFVPQSVWDKRQKEGITLPKIVSPGPDNPLGPRSMRLSNPSYLIHGTNNPEGIGKRSTAGCISMYPEDVIQLYKKTPVKTKVTVINEDVKWLLKDNKLCVEVHHPVDLVSAKGATVADHELALNEQQQKFNLLALEYNISNNEQLYWDIILEEKLGVPQCVHLAKKEHI